MWVNRVPGIFQFTAFTIYFNLLSTQFKSANQDFDATSTHLSHVLPLFSVDAPLPNHVARHFPSEVLHNLDPLDGRAFNNTEYHATHEHYIKVLSPTIAKSSEST